MNDRKVIRRRRAVLGLLVVASLALLTAYFDEPVSGGLHAVQRGAQQVLEPLQTGASRVFKPVRDFAGWTGDTLRAQSENETLRQENRRLRNELARAEVDERDTEQLRALMGVSENEGFVDEYVPVTARIIARSPSQWYSSVTINRGREDGVRADQPVITGDGLAGRIASASNSTAQVNLITDATSAVAAQIQPDGPRGVVKPDEGNPRDLLLDYIQRGRRVKEGARVVTSGSAPGRRLQSLFPRGIPIGRVRRVEPDELELYQRVHLEPFADLREADFVQVLTSGGDVAGERAATGQDRADTGSPAP